MSARAEAENGALRVPPHSVEAEQSVLGGLLLDNSAWDRAADLITDSDFYRYEHRHIYAAIGTLVAATKPADVITVFEQLQRAGKANDCGGLVYLNDLVRSVPSAANMRRYAEIVRDRAVLRRLIGTSEEIVGRAWASDDPAGLLDDAATKIADLQQGTLRQVPRHGGDLLPERLDHWNDLATGAKPRGMSTGIPSIDRAINGLRPGMVYVLAARPSKGKTSLAMAMLLGMAKNGVAGCLLSQEMPAEECMDRATANVGQIDYEHLQTGEFDDLEWQQLSEAADSLRTMPFYVDDQAGLSLAQIRAKAVALRRQGLQVLVIDYLQLCDYQHQKGQTESSAIGLLSKGIKKLAKDLRLAVILLSQLNREVERRADPEPSLADLRDSGAIEQDADVVMMLYEVRTFTDRQIMGLSFRKNRQGKFKGRLALEFQGKYQRWYESTADLAERPRRTAADDL